MKRTSIRDKSRAWTSYLLTRFERAREKQLTTGVATGVMQSTHVCTNLKERRDVAKTLGPKKGEKKEGHADF